MERRSLLSRLKSKISQVLPKTSKPSKRRRRRRVRTPKGRFALDRVTWLKFPQQTLTHLGQKFAPLSNKFQVARQKRSFWIIFGLSSSLSGGLIVLGAGIFYLEQTTPQSVQEVLTYSRRGTLTIEAANGEILQEIGYTTHEELKLSQYPPHVLESFIASEDSRFQSHRGVDIPGIVRATVTNLRSGKVVQGGSTLTQQLARIVFLNQERRIERKLKEMWIAHKIEQELTKSQILERYLNLVYLGSGAYGVGDAAWVYFSKKVSELTLAEAATLAGIVPAPSLYSPLRNPELAKKRRNQVLDRLLEEGWITPQTAATAKNSPLTLNPSQPKRLNRKAPYFTEYVQKQLPKYVSEEILTQGGIRVITTLNPTWQEAAEKALTGNIKRYGKWQRYQQGALVAIIPQTGEIKAMVGGDDFFKNPFNRVTQAQRQPGSTFKMFVYAAAIAAGIPPQKSYLNAEYVVDGYKPENYGDEYSGNKLSLRDALTKSVNVVAVRLLIDVGWTPVIQLAEQMGISSKLHPTYSLALGASEVNLLELTSAYGTLANQGIHQKPYGIQRIVDRKGNILYQAQLTPKKALEPQITSLVTFMLQGVVDRGTGIPAQIGRPVAGKTGTSDKARDLWFVGYIPQVAAGIWLGNDDNQPTRGSSAMAAALWRKFMLEVVEGMPIKTFGKTPKLTAQKAIIKAQPLKPKKSYYKLPEPPKTEKTDEDQPQRRRRVRRKRTRQERRDRRRIRVTRQRRERRREVSRRRRVRRREVSRTRKNPPPLPKIRVSAPKVQQIPVSQPD